MPDEKDTERETDTGEKNAKVGKDADTVSIGLVPRIVAFIKSWLLEMFAFTFIISYSVRNITMSSFLLERVCVISMNLSSENCSSILTLEDSLREKITKIANDYNLYATLISTGPAAVLALFIGPWSDKYGRRIPVLAGSLGEILKAIGLILMALNPELPPYYILYTSIPAGLCGGWTNALAAITSQTSATSNKESRTIRLFFIGMCVALGFPSGQLLGGLLYKYFGTVGVFFTSVVLGLISLPLSYFAIAASKVSADWKTKAADFFSLDNMRDNLKVCLKKRPNYGRAEIWLFTVSSILLSQSDFVMVSVGYYFAHNEYNWDNSEFSTYSGIVNFASMGLMVPVVLVMTKVMHCNDYTLILVAGISLIAKNILRGIPKNPLYFFIGYAVGIPSRSSHSGIKSILSKTVEKNELGKVFALMSSLESLLPLFSSSMYSQIYNASISFFSGMAFMVAAVLAVFPLCVTIWGYRNNLKREKVVKIELESACTKL